MALSMGWLASPATADTTTCTAALANLGADRTIVGDVLATPGASCSLAAVTVTGSVIVAPQGRLSLVSSTVLGNVTASQPGGLNFTILNSTIKGGLYINGSGSPNIRLGICRSTILGSLIIQNFSAPGGAVVIGPACDSVGTNIIGGSVVLTNVSAAVNVPFPSIQVANNQIGANLVCFADAPVPTVSGNTVKGAASGQCAPNANT